MKHLIKHIKKYGFKAVLSPLLKMIEACFELLVPLTVAEMIDVGIEHGDRNFIITRFVFLMVLALLGLVCSFTAQYFAAYVSVSAATDLRHSLFEHVGTLSFAELDGLGSSTLITRMVHDAGQVQHSINMFLRLVLRSPLIVVGSAALAFVIDPSLALIFVATEIILALLIFGIMRLITPLYKKAQRQLDDITVTTRENITGVRVVRAFGMEEREREAFDEVNEHLHHTHVKVGRIGALTAPASHFVIHFATILILWLGAMSVNNGRLMPGDVLALVTYLTHVLTELVKLAHLVVYMGRGAASMGRIEQVLNTKVTMTYGSRTCSEQDSREAIRLSEVSLRYKSGILALCDIDLSIMQGQTVGIVGSTGSGKSALAAVIGRFYDATEGRVCLFGHPVSEWDKHALRSMVELVMQQPQLFRGTIRENLLFGDGNATDEQLWEALTVAQAAEFVAQKEGGLDHVVDEGGLNLSGGQKQRLTIARALLTDPKILILDDSTSLLDNETAKKLMTALRRWAGDERTVLVVSDRVSDVRDADAIYVLDDGELVGSGTHEVLMDGCAVYREMQRSLGREEAAV